MVSAPLPLRDGVAPSRVHLPHGPWLTVLEFLEQRFARIPAAVLRARLEQGHIVDASGVPLGPDTPYRPDSWLWYYREVEHEPVVPFEIDVLYRDDRLLVVDKPHFLASIPGGRHVRETALSRLRAQLDWPQLTPVHRLDRDTAGVMLFCLDPASRGAYQRLFQQRQVHKEYEAIAPWLALLATPRVHRSRLVNTEQHFTVTQAEGPPNSETRIEMLQRQGSWARYRLQPVTGRKHQLRVHMAALGAPICNDRCYPVWHADDTDDYARPLQLLARTLSFVDPYSGQAHHFESRRRLEWPEGA